MRHPRFLASLFALAGAVLWLASCSQGVSDPMAVFNDQTLRWTECDPARLDGVNLVYHRVLADRTRCADIRAPRDYANPGLGEVTIALLRVEVPDVTQRQGAILINPGGPGLDGLAYPLGLSLLWDADGNTDDVQVVGLYKQLARRYDLIGFSPRGTGHSTRLDCIAKRPFQFVANPTRDLSASNMEAVAHNGRVVAEACRDEPLSAHINTEATARDMDLVRRLLRDEKLNYIGLSYGTWLGNWYAALFPERVGRMLLSGVVDLSQPLSHQHLPQEAGMQRVLDEVIIPYAARYPQRFNLGGDPAVIRRMLDALPDAWHGAVVRALERTNIISTSLMVDEAALVLLAAKILPSAFPASADEATMRAWIAAHDFVPGTLNESARFGALEVAANYVRERDRVPETEVQGMFWSVVCNDSGTRYTETQWITEGNRNAGSYSDFGGWLRDNPCLYWPDAGIVRPAQDRVNGAGGLVLLQSELDPLTVLAGARSARGLLSKASFIEIRGEYVHAPLPPYGRACVDRPIAEYFLNGTQPAREIACERRLWAAELQ